MNKQQNSLTIILLLIGEILFLYTITHFSIDSDWMPNNSGIAWQLNKT